MRRELYFTEEELVDEVRSMQQKLADSGCDITSGFHVPMGMRPALLIMDMQDYFLSPESHAFIPSAAAIVDNIRCLQELFLAKRWLVVFTRHLNTPRDAGRMADHWGRIITLDDPLSGITAALSCRESEVIDKIQYDAFYRTGLDERLERDRVDTVVVTGVMTHLCCETTARSAFVHGYRVIMPMDGTATYNRGFHQASLINLNHGFGATPPVADLLYALDSGSRHG